MRNSILSFLIFTLFLLSGIIYLQLKPETDSTPLVDKKLTATNWESSVGNQFVSTQSVTETRANSSITTPPNTIETATVAVPMVDFTSVAAHTTPCVVHIKTTSNNNNSSLGEMWGGSNGSGGSSGSGVIISKDGYIVTNYHVIEGAGAIEVILNNRRNLDAQVIGTDPSTDLAVIRVSDSNLESIAFGDSDKLQVGEWVMAVGNPFNLASTVTTGIVSAKARNINILEDNLAIESFIQTDAAVNPGNSGGALVNLSGQLIGVNTAIATPTGYYAGYAFAVPVNIVRKVVTDIVEFGEVKRGFLGVSIRGIDGKLAKRYKLDEVEGVYVANVNINSAAANADIKEGDIILEVEGVKVNSAPELQERISLHRPGAHVSLLIKRDNKNMLKDVLLKGSY